MEKFFRIGYILLGFVIACFFAYWMWDGEIYPRIEPMNMPQWINKFLNGTSKALSSFAGWAVVVIVTVWSHDKMENFFSKNTARSR